MTSEQLSEEVSPGFCVLRHFADLAMRDSHEALLRDASETPCQALQIMKNYQHLKRFEYEVKYLNISD